MGRPRKHEKEGLIPFNTRLAPNLYEKIANKMQMLNNRTIQDVVAEALTMWLDQSDSYGWISALSSQEQEQVQAWAKAYTRKEKLARIAFEIMEANYEEWRDRSEQKGPALAGNRSRADEGSGAD